jgi:hypothetical protein
MDVPQYNLTAAIAVQHSASTVDVAAIGGT